jgi:hypothetical protein
MLNLINVHLKYEYNNIEIVYLFVLFILAYMYKLLYTQIINLENYIFSN